MTDNDSNCGNKLTPEEARQCARDNRDIVNTLVSYASQRSCELSDEFTRLEVQMATILFAFSGLFLGMFKEGLELDQTGSFFMKAGFVAILFFLLSSLLLGLLHIKRKEKFWDDTLRKRAVSSTEWNAAVMKKTSFIEAVAYHRGTVAVDNDNTLIRSPIWTWVLQTIALGIAVSLMFILATVYLFAYSTSPMI